ncbi:hypothetical protein Tco_1518086 [Tanacetum coccineum]
MYIVKHCARKDVPIRSPTRIRAGLGEHLAPMERLDKIPIGDRGRKSCLGACVFTNKWSLDELAYGVPTDGPYQTNPPIPDDIISSIRIDREGQVRCIRHEEEIDVLEYQILTHEIVPTLKPLEEIIRENVF